MTQLNVTVIIPVHNRKSELVRAVKSVLCQKFTPHEVIIIDDFSNFSVSEFLKVEFNNPIIKVITNKKNLGAAASRNKGIEVATGDYIAFLDSDDYWHHNKLMHQIEVAISNPSIDLIYTDQLVERDGVKCPSRKELIKSNLSHRLSQGWTAPNTSTLLFKKSSLAALGGFNEALSSCQDHDLWFKVAEIEMLIDFVPEPLSVFVQESTNRISYHLENRMAGVEKFLSLWKTYIVNHHGLKSYTMFERDYYFKASYPVFTTAIRNKKYTKALVIYFKYLFKNVSFYSHMKTLITKRTS